MGRLTLICRLAARDLRRRRAEAVLLLLVITAATTTLTVGLALRQVTEQPYQQTRQATNGPDVVARLHALGSQPVSTSDLPGLTALARRPGVTGHGGPYPVTWTVIRAQGRAVGATVVGRDTSPSRIDQPELIQGNWLEHGGVVVEAALAEALGVAPGDSITLNSRSFKVSGTAVTAAIAPYPAACLADCEMNASREQKNNTGLVWVTDSDARSLATAEAPLYYMLNLKLADPDTAEAFGDDVDTTSAPTWARTHPENVMTAETWQEVRHRDGRLAEAERDELLIGGWLLGMLAVASVAVLVGGRMADQTRRVGLLKAVGGTPRLVGGVLLAEYLFIALLAAALGLGVGALVAPLFTSPGAGLLGSSGVPPVTALTAAVVVGTAVLVAVMATLVPAIRAARTSTVRALADAARPARRRGWLTVLSARLPVPMLLGLRLAARRPHRLLLGVAGVAITVSGIVAVLTADAHTNAQRSVGPLGLDHPQVDQLDRVMLLITLMLAALASVNAIFIAWATVLDARHASALTRALGATPQQVTAALVAAQALPALLGALLGIPGGLLFHTALKKPGATMNHPPALWLAAVVVGSVLVAGWLTAVPARMGARRPVAEALAAETA